MRLKCPFSTRDSNWKCHSQGDLPFGRSLPNRSSSHPHPVRTDVTWEASMVISKGAERLLSRHTSTKLRRSSCVIKTVDHIRGLLINAVRQKRQTWVKSKRSYRFSLVRGKGMTRWKMTTSISMGILVMEAHFGGGGSRRRFRGGSSWSAPVREHPDSPESLTDM